MTVVVVGLDGDSTGPRRLFREDDVALVDHINPYLTTQRVDIVTARRTPAFVDVELEYGVYYSKSADLILSPEEVIKLRNSGVPSKFFRQFLGSNEFINGMTRYCLWISDDDVNEATAFPMVASRVAKVKADRLATGDKSVNKLAQRPHQFREFKGDERQKLFVPLVSSESRPYFPAGLVGDDIIATNKACYAPYAPLWALAILVSKLHLVWIGTVCGRLEMRYSYSNTLGWNTFPMPSFSDQNKADLTRCAEEILLAREAHFPATIADLYDPENIPADLRAAHDRNDETLERIYIGRRFKNETERLEKLFELYTQMIAKQSAVPKKATKRKTKGAEA